MKRLKTRIIIETLSLAFIFSLLLLAAQKNLLALGIFIGALTGIACFHLLVRHITQGVSCGPQRAKPYFFLKYLIRYVIMGVVLFLCARIGLNLFLGAAAGLLLIYLAIFFDSFIMNEECKIPAK